MNFQLHDHWVVNLIEGDFKTTIGRRTRYFEFATEEGFRTFVSRCNIENMEDFEISMWNWARGSNYCNLTDQQYARLKT